MEQNETKSLDWQKYFKELNYVSKGTENTYLISLDTEYTQSTKYTNTCLSYQVSALRTHDDNYQEKFIDIKNDQRKNLLEIIHETLELFPQVEVGGITRIILIAHNSVAEISMLKDREDYIHNLQIIRRTLTTNRVIALEIEENKYNIEIYDSMLIAPIGFHALKKLGEILGRKDMMKIEIAQNDLENMDKFKLREPDKFKEYAMQDARVTLAVWLALQTQLNELVIEPIQYEDDEAKKDKRIKYYKTLGSAAVRAFLMHVKYQELKPTSGEKSKDFIQKLLHPNYAYNNFINNTYFGGRNESFYIGYTQDDETIKDKYIFVDIDFSGAYPTGISSIPKVSGEVENCIESNKMIHKWYEKSKDNKDTVILGFADISFKFPNEISFPSLPVKHKQYGLIYPLEGETLATAVEIIFYIEQLKAYDPKIDIDKYITVKKSIEFLPELIEDKPNLLLKRYFEDKILKRSKAKNVIKISEDKEDINKAKLQDKLLKELVNSVYGKFGQSINKKNTYDLAKSVTKPLTKSPITSPYIASTTTGVVRSALSALIYSVEAYNKDSEKKLLLISATTDGALLGIPLESIDDKKVINYDRPDKTKISELLPSFINKLEEFYPIQLLKQTRKSFGEEYLEVKHLATEVYSVKTRGQIGYLRDSKTKKRKVSILAKFGHKPPLSDLYDKEIYKDIMGDVDRRNEADAKWLIRKYKQIKQKHKKIKTYKVRSLIGARKIFDKHELYQDLVGINVEKKINFDYDYKRLLENNSPHTKPYKNLKEMLKHRYAMETVRKCGINANSSLVEAKVQTKNTNVRIRGSLYDHALKITLRGIFSKINSLSQQKIKAKVAVENINKYLKENGADIKLINEDTIKNAKRFKFEFNSIPNTPKLKDFVKAIYIQLDIPYQNSYAEKYFAKNTRMLDQLTTLSEKSAFKVFLQWLFRASKTQNKNIPIFGKLNLPEVDILKDELIDCILGTELCFNDDELREYFTEAINYQSNLKYNQIANTKGSKAVIEQMRLAIYRYIPECDNSNKNKRQKKIFTLKDFNNLLLERIDFITIRKNPAKESCLKYFLLAYLNNIVGFNSNNISKHKNMIIIDRLASFGLTKSKFYQIKKDKFIYKALKDTPENRTQVRNMCKRLDIDYTNSVINALL